MLYITKRHHIQRLLRRIALQRYCYFYIQKTANSRLFAICGEVGECSGKERGKQRGTIAVLALMLELFLMHLSGHDKYYIVFENQFLSGYSFSLS